MKAKNIERLTLAMGLFSALALALLVLFFLSGTLNAGECTCPWCGNPVEISKVEAPEKPEPPEPPTPPSPRERFILGAGAFEISDAAALQKAGLSNTDFITWWRDAAGGTWQRFQSPGYHNDPARGRGIPAMIHVPPDSKYTYSDIVGMIEQNAQWGANYAWHIYDERSWDNPAMTLGGRSPWYWLDYVRERWPRMLVFTGPLAWTDYDQAEHFAPFDAIVSYQNATRPGRDPYDYWYHQALANLYGKRLIFSCNLLDSGEPPDFADPARYETFLRQGAYANGMLVWGAGDLYLVAKGVKAGVHSERVPELIALINRVTEFQEAALERIKIRLAFVPPTSANGNGWKRNVALCHIAGRAGFDPMPVLLGEGEKPSGAWGFADGALTNGTISIPLPADYLGNVVMRADTGHWTPELDAAVEAAEAALAEKLKDAQR